MNVKQVDVPSFSGNFGILPNHVPSLAVLKPGVVTVYEDAGGSKKFFGIIFKFCCVLDSNMYLNGFVVPNSKQWDSHH